MLSTAWRLANNLRTQILDPKLGHSPGRYLAQCAAATVALFIIIIAEELFFARQGLGQPVVVAAIGSTAFVLFIMPHSRPARPRSALGGHLVAVAVGSLAALIVGADMDFFGHAGVGPVFALEASVTVGAALLGMAATNTEHPPAAGTALAMAIQPFSWPIVFFLATSVTGLFLIHWLLRPYLRDLY